MGNALESFPEKGIIYLAFYVMKAENRQNGPRKAGKAVCIYMNYEEAVRYIAEVPKFTEEAREGNTRRLLRGLGDPQEDLRIIHVAGTNGKGSVCAFLASMLQAAGHRTGLFTSPHLVRINERFRINGVPVGDEELAEAFGSVMSAVEEMAGEGWRHPTYFELLFAVGMVIFRREGVGYLVMETGMGGRLDATNAVEHPLACVITSVSLDHMKYLGNTVREIAGEKAGIIREGVPLIYDGTSREAEEVILEQARKKHAPVWAYYPGMAEITCRGDSSVTYVLNNRLFDYLEITVPFAADYQVANSALAMMAMRVLDPAKQITDRMLKEAVVSTRWPGRMQEILPGVILDGAHNADGIAQLAGTMERIAERRKVSLLFAAVSDKEYERMIRELTRTIPYSSVVVTQTGGARHVEAEVFAELFRRYVSCPVYEEADAGRALEKALELKDPDGVLFCAGSLYLAGEILSFLQEKQCGKKDEDTGAETYRALPQQGR